MQAFSFLDAVKRWLFRFCDGNTEFISGLLPPSHMWYSYHQCWINMIHIGPVVILFACNWYQMRGAGQGCVIISAAIPRCITEASLVSSWLWLQSDNTLHFHYQPSMTAAVVVFFAIWDIDKLDKGGILAITGVDSPLGSSASFFLKRCYS